MNSLGLGNDVISREERTVKKRRIQSQLLMLLHAQDCNDSGCSRPNCSQFKSLAEHLKNCGDGVVCQHPYCNSSRIILKHWEKCESRTCPVCYPIEIIAGVTRGSLRRILLSSSQQVPDLFPALLLPQNAPPPPPSTLPQDQLLQQPHQQPRERQPQHLSNEQYPIFQFQQHQHQQQQQRDLPSPTPPSDGPGTNQNTSTSRFGPIRGRRHLIPSRPDAAGFIRRVAKLRGSLLSESKSGDVDVKIDDVVVERGVDARAGGGGGGRGLGRRLDEELEFHRRRAECPVCWEHLKSVALQCGHQCCHRCAQNLDKCHSCRSKILLKIKLY